MEKADFYYWAFISYSRKDADWAEWLQTSIEKYRVPYHLRQAGSEAFPKYLFPTYRDTEEQEASADLGAAIRRNLEISRYLIVICSPRSAQSEWVNEEVNYFKSLGRAGRILCLIVDGEPNAAPGSGQAECFPVALRSSRGQPAAPDLRQGKDTKRRVLIKLVAGILGVRFNELWRRELRRLVHRIVRNSLASIALASFLVLLYLGVADHGVAVPGGEAIRSRIDHYDVSFFRPSYSIAEIIARADSSRAPIVERLRREWTSDEWLHTTPTRTAAPTKSISPWISSQAASAMLHALGKNDSELRAMLEEPFRRGFPIKVDGKPYGWFAGDVNYPQVQPALWTVAAIAVAVSNTNLVGSAQDRDLLAHLDTAQEIADAYYTNPNGGWNIVPNQSRPNEHAVTATALGYFTLLELQHAKLGWRGDVQILKNKIDTTANWLIQRFDRKARSPGWHIQLNETGTSERGEVADGLTLMIYAQFLRAEMEGGFQIPKEVLGAIPKHIDQLVGRPANFPNSRSSTTRYFIDIEGRSSFAEVPETHLWYPWAVEVSARWLHKLEREGSAYEARVKARRALGHLIVELGDQSLGSVASSQRSPTFVASETLYALGTVYALFHRAANAR